MVEPQASRFWHAAIKSGLLDEATLKAAWDSIPPEKRTHDAIDRRLARQIVNAGRITLWQAQQLLAGRWQGLRIAKYELMDVIGHGGMGRVYLAKDTRLNRQVALKILSRERMNNPRAMARFRREAKVGAQLQHENLVRIYDEGDAHGVRFLVMEFIEGRTVGRLIADRGRLSPATAATLARQVALGLEHLHQKGLLHRDVNPMNILVDRDGTAKLTDLGLAIDLGDIEDVVTRDGATVGTFDYISPEQAKHSRSVDARSDLYSLGCSLYQMLTGRVPFPTPSLPEKLYAHQLSEPEALSIAAPDVPEGLALVVSRLMKKTPDERYRSAVEAARALEPFISGSLTPQEIADATAVTVESSGSPQASGATPQGSDPDLDLKPGSNPLPTPSTPASDPMDAFRIDLGPDPPLSRSRLAALKSETATDEIQRRVFPARKILSGLAVVAAAALLLSAAIVLWKRLPPRPRITPRAVAIEEKAPTGPPADVAIRYPDGTESAQTDLRGAIRHLSGGGGEIVLRGKTAIRAGEIGKALRLDGGHLRISAESAKPELLVDLSARAAWIEVSPQAKLTLVGLSIRAEAPPGDAKPGDASPTLIASGGGLVLDRCAFFTTGSDRSIRAVACDGGEFRASGCEFEGFDCPISLGMYPGTQARLSQCLFVRDVTTDPAAGWAIAATRKNALRSTGPRKLSIDRCTNVGAGLIIAQGFTEDGPLFLDLTQTAVRGAALLMTNSTKESLSKSVIWAGKENDYALSGVAWVVSPPKGFDAMPGGPNDLKSWIDLVKNDPGSRDDPLKFSGSSTGEGRVPEDFALTSESDKPPLGADPSKVGPGAKP